MTTLGVTGVPVAIEVADPKCGHAVPSFGGWVPLGAGGHATAAR